MREMNMKRWIACLTAILALSPALTAQAETHYWRLGAGFYAGESVGNPSDEARWDWLLVNLGNMGARMETVHRLNRNLQLNPRQKYLVELFPEPHCRFLEYRYRPEVKQALEQETRRQVRLFLDNIAKPENIIGFTFMEEVPGGSWGHSSAIAWAEDPNQLPRFLEGFRKEIEAERGKPLVWNDETRLWVGTTFVNNMNSVHRVIKEEAPDKLVLLWHKTTIRTLDELGVLLPADAPLATRGLYPYRLSDVIKPGLCEGLFAYPRNPGIWKKRYIRFARQNGWLFFSQLSHPGCYRLGSWEDELKMVKTEVPQNLGYFLFCQGNCTYRRQWNEDPGIPLDKPEENLSMDSIPLHIRRFFAQEKIGMDVLARYLRLQAQVDVPLKGAQAGDVIRVVAIVQNPKEESYYLSPDEAVANEVSATLHLPEGFTLDTYHSPPATLPFGDLKPLEAKSAEWWVTVTQTPKLLDSNPIKVMVTSENTEPGEAIVTQDTQIPAFQVHEVRGSGESWIESTCRQGGDFFPTIVMEGLAKTPVKNPSLSDGVNTLTYEGDDISAGRKVVITRRGHQARLYAADLPEEGVDVSKKVYGSGDPGRGIHPMLQPGAFAVITYRDDDVLPSREPKLRIQLQPPSQEN